MRLNFQNFYYFFYLLLKKYLFKKVHPFFSLDRYLFKKKNKNMTRNGYFTKNSRVNIFFFTNLRKLINQHFKINLYIYDALRIKSVA